MSGQVLSVLESARLSDARVSIEVHGTSVSPTRTSINTAGKRVVGTECYYNF